MQSNKDQAAAPKRPKGETYVSFNRDEWTAMQKLGFRERWAYMQLKWLANFKTGEVGKFGRQRLTYTGLAKLVDAPPVQGRGMGAIDDTQARDFLQRMQAVGLVEDIATKPKGGLTFTLPLSPMERNKQPSEPSEKPSQAHAAEPPTSERQTASSEIFSPKEIDASEIFFPSNDLLPFDEALASMRLSDHRCTAPSILTKEKEKISNDGPQEGSAFAAPLSRATCAAVLLGAGFASPMSDKHISAEDIKIALERSRDFCETDSVESLALYIEWEQRGLLAGQLRQAISQVGEVLPPDEWLATPKDLDRIVKNLLSISHSAESLL